MAHQLRAQVTVPIDDGLPENYVTNTFCFDGGDLGATPEETADDAEGILNDFYSSVSQLFAQIAGPVATVKWYNLADAEPRQVIKTGLIPLAPGTGVVLPSEVAMVVSFAADGPSANPGSIAGVPIANRRGRIYLGPVDGDNITITGGQSFITDAAVDALADAAEALMNAGDVDKHWAIYSPTWHHGRGPTSGGRPGGAGPLPAIPPHDLEDSVWDVKKVWVDNAFDTQRRRGPEATSRQVRYAA